MLDVLNGMSHASSFKFLNYPLLTGRIETNTFSLRLDVLLNSKDVFKIKTCQSHYLWSELVVCSGYTPTQPRSVSESESLDRNGRCLRTNRSRFFDFDSPPVWEKKKCTTPCRKATFKTPSLMHIAYNASLLTIIIIAVCVLTSVRDTFVILERELE